MYLKDQGLIIFIKIIKEKNLYIRILSKDHGLKSGIVYGGNSKKLKNIYLVGSYINFNYSKKNENNIGSINAELINPLISNIYNDRYKLYAILTCCSLINSVINENQKFNNIFSQTSDFVISLNNKHWFNNYVIWILNFFQELGYGFDWKQIKLNKKFIYLENMTFSNEASKDFYCLEFPYDLILNKKIVYNECIIFFQIIEFIMNNHILHQSSIKIPKIYFDFKSTILNKLNKNND